MIKDKSFIVTRVNLSLPLYEYFAGNLYIYIYIQFVFEAEFLEEEEEERNTKADRKDVL